MIKTLSDCIGLIIKSITLFFIAALLLSFYMAMQAMEDASPAVKKVRAEIAAERAAVMNLSNVGKNY